MKLTHIALVAVLTLPSAAWAASIDNAGPHRVSRDQAACQNLNDADDLDGAHAIKNQADEARLWAKLGGEENAVRERLCIMLRKGTPVTVVKRTAGYECVQVKGRPANACFYTRNVSGTTNRAKEPVYDGFYVLD